VTTNFSELESAVIKKEKEQTMLAASAASVTAATAPPQRQNSEHDAASLSLAYKELSMDSKKMDEKMKNLDPKKKEQLERLGMGSSGTRGVSHSAFADMQSITQEAPSGANSRYSGIDRYSSRGSRDRDFDDDFELIRSGPPRFDNAFSLKPEDRYSSSSSGGRNNASWDTSTDATENTVEDIPSINKDTPADKSRSRKVCEVSDTTDAQKKFGNAKAISSDQYFGGKDADYETRQNLSKFEGSSSISSAELFGGSGPNRSSTGGATSAFSRSDLADIRDGVRQGVTKVAGRLSSLASGVISSVQDNFG
jgi:ADP-ribosylation factor GTPase-activating protein 2/3